MRSMRNHRAKPASNKPTKTPINSSICTNFKNLVQRYMFRVQRYCTRKEKNEKAPELPAQTEHYNSDLIAGKRRKSDFSHFDEVRVFGNDFICRQCVLYFDNSIFSICKLFIRSIFKQIPIYFSLADKYITSSIT